MFKYYLYRVLRFFRLLSKKKYKKKTAKYTKEYKVLARSKLFDAKWYLKHNPDVKKAKADPIMHYLKSGWKEEGRKCSPYFNGELYLKMYPDVSEANINPLVHWEMCGKKENRYAEIRKKGLFGKIHSILLYPMTVYEEYQILSANVKGNK